MVLVSPYGPVCPYLSNPILPALRREQDQWWNPEAVESLTDITATAESKEGYCKEQ
jgi:hypothetical protein